MDSSLAKLGFFFLLLAFASLGAKAELEHPNAAETNKLDKRACLSNVECGNGLCVNRFCDYRSDFKEKGLKFEAKDPNAEIDIVLSCESERNCPPGCRCFNARCECHHAN
ncbi:uncharacterized protein LOC107637581 [Arachis ipaensis]|uniref:uncharacterized protein LOC107637581 n=1 Tax=Arachis ipaensis TaxID=130454 RepID=UPI0007AFC4BB|nr:uncharacterized protein LOC107637581 [Arachis ipaensis]XP_025644824.1 uncharacterized protein LOC112740266 [Arachis hypogaea]QHO06468.1 uncharacterized protein DS421_14g454900 [Arachis hypogaea]